jgi:hypothetical protein
MKIVGFLLSLMVVLSTPCYAAVAYVTSATGTETGTDADISLTIDAGAAANRLLICAVAFTTVGITVTSVKHNSIDLTESPLGPVCDSDYCIDIWSMVNPASGSLSVDAVLSTTGANKILSCMAFSGVSQSGPIGTADLFSNYTDPATVSVTIPAGGMGAAFAIANDQTNAGSYTADANSTVRYDLADTDGTFAAIGSTSATAGTNDMTISNPNGDYMAMIALPINQATVTTATRRQPIVMQ